VDPADLRDPVRTLLCRVGGCVFPLQANGQCNAPASKNRNQKAARLKFRSRSNNTKPGVSGPSRRDGLQSASCVSLDSKDPPTHNQTSETTTGPYSSHRYSGSSSRTSPPHFHDHNPIIEKLVLHTCVITGLPCPIELSAQCISLVGLYLLYQPGPRSKSIQRCDDPLAIPPRHNQDVAPLLDLLPQSDYTGPTMQNNVKEPVRHASRNALNVVRLAPDKAPGTVVADHHKLRLLPRLQDDQLPCGTRVFS